MGLFRKLKDNLTGGGVKVSFDAPDSIMLDGSEIPLNVTITNGDTERSVEKVVLQLIEISEESSLGYSDEDGSSKEETVLLESISSVTFTLNAQESRVVPLTLRGRALDTANTPTFTGKAKAALAKISDALDTNDYTYLLKVRADVKGIAVDPSCTKPVTVTRRLSSGQ